MIRLELGTATGAQSGSIQLRRVWNKQSFNNNLDCLCPLLFVFREAQGAAQNRREASQVGSKA
jgi:hypothetical protein